MKLQTPVGELSIEIDRHPDAEFVVVLAHGAGAPMLHPFMTEVGSKISMQGGHVIRFNFPYIEKGRKSPGAPGPNIKAIGHIVEYALESFPELPIFLSGKSYGGRMSSHWLEDNSSNSIQGIIYFGFPLHAPGRDGKDRAQHLYDLELPQLFIQGTRDALANYTLIQEVVNDCPKGEIHTIETADHSFRVLKKVTGKTQDEVMDEIANVAAGWIKNLT